MEESSQSFNFKYEGDFESLDAITVLQTQLDFVSVLNEIKNHEFPEVNIDVEIKGLKKGSLDVQHVIEVTAVAGMFVMENYKYVGTIFKIFGDLIKLKKFLKGEKADAVKKVSDTVVEVHLIGDNITVHKDAIKIYQNSPVVTHALTNTGRLLDNREEIQFIKVTDEANGESLEVDKSEFKILGAPNPYLTGKIEDQLYKDQVLFIKKPNLFPEKRKKWVWEFLHQGRDIKGIIVDEQFMSKINNGLKVGQGDRLQANLKIYYKFDEKLATFIESGKYEVSNITRLIERQDQAKFDL